MAASIADFQYSTNDNNNGPWDEWCCNNAGAFLPFPSAWPSDDSLVQDLSHAAMSTKSSVVPFPTFINPESLQSFSASSTSPTSNGDSEEYETSMDHSKKRKLHDRRDRHDTKSSLQAQDSVMLSRPHHHLHHQLTSQEPPHSFSRKVVPEPVRRERNRTAAAKCRAKSKAAEEGLKEVQRIERDRNKILRASLEQLTNEALMLKHELLGHSDCNHPVIDKYLMRAADRISNGHNHHTKSPTDSVTSEADD